MTGASSPARRRAPPDHRAETRSGTLGHRASRFVFQHAIVQISRTLRRSGSCNRATPHPRSVCPREATHSEVYPAVRASGLPRGTRSAPDRRPGTGRHESRDRSTDGLGTQSAASGSGAARGRARRPRRTHSWRGANPGRPYAMAGLATTTCPPRSTPPPARGGTHRSTDGSVGAWERASTDRSTCDYGFDGGRRPVRSRSISPRRMRRIVRSCAAIMGGTAVRVPS